MLLTVDIPDEVARRLDARVPADERGRFLARAVERALPRHTEEELEVIAAQVEADQALTAEMREFDVCAADGVDEHF